VKLPGGETTGEEGGQRALLALAQTACRCCDRAHRPPLSPLPEGLLHLHVPVQLRSLSTSPPYAPAQGFFDELFEAPGRGRTPAESLKIGHGRFYGDVAPIRGVYKGTAETAEPDVTVKMTRLS
jgi:hypothetical protein